MNDKDVDKVLPPHKPFFKDERFGTSKITMQFSVRVLLVSLIAFVLVIGIASWQLLNETQANHKLGLQVQQSLKEGRASRLAAQAQTDAKIKELVCFIIHDFPNSPKAPLIQSLREKYKCPTFIPVPKPTTKPASSPQPSTSAVRGTPVGTALATAQVQAQAQPATAAPARSLVAVASVGPSTRPTSTPSQPNRPTPTPPAVTSTPTPTTTPLIDLGGLTCSTLGICILKK